MNYTLGLDIGISSVGWAVVENGANGEPIKISALGVRVFDKAEQPKTGASLAAPRREARSSRRRLRRHRHRLERIKQLIERNGIMTLQEMSDMFTHSGFEKDVYTLRAEALDRALSPSELTRVLIHLAQRRGYKSNSTAEAVKDKETGKVKEALVENQRRMEERGYRTVGEMFAKDEQYRQLNPDGTFTFRTRNKQNEYKFTVSRDMVASEAKKIFSAQRAYDSPYASEAFENNYLNILLSQRSFDEGPGGDSPFGGNRIEAMLGQCTFEKDKPRAVKASYTFEYFKLLQDINHIRLLTPESSGLSLDSSQRKALISLAHRSQNLTFARIRKELAISDNVTFNVVRYDKAGRDESEKKAKFNEMQSYHEIRLALDKLEKGAIASLTHEQLDSIARVLTLYRADKKREEELAKIGLPVTYIEALLPLSFSKAGRLSIEAMRKIIPYLEQGNNYDVACTAVYGDFRGHKSTQRANRLHLEDAGDIPNPVVKRAVAQSIKVINAVIRAYGAPQFVRVELARELSFNFNDRRKAEKQNEENRTRNELAKSQIEEIKGSRATGEDIVKFKLWQEQDGICLYSGTSIDTARLFEPGYVDVDHVIPYSLSFDDSYNNKVLVLSLENRQKGNRLPSQYLSASPEKLARFRALVENKVKNYRKRQKLLKETLTEDDLKGFKERNLNDTKYIARTVYHLINDNLEFAPSQSKRPVTAVNGSITAYLRKRWGIEKIRDEGDKHHAVDAAVIAVASQGLINRISRYSQRREMHSQSWAKGEYLDYETGEIISRDAFDEKYTPDFPQPWDLFRKELAARAGENPYEDIMDLKLATYDPDEIIRPIFVSRMPNHKVTGPAHKETIQSAKEEGYTIAKKPLSELKLKNGEIEGYYRPDSDMLLYNALRERLIAFNGNAKEAFSAPFYKPRRDGTPGPLVNKVKLLERSTSNVSIRGGVANNGAMIRIDVFYVMDVGYYFVPVYVTDTLGDRLPDRAVVARKPKNDWKVMNDADFIFSLYPGDLLRVESENWISLSLANTNAGGEQTRMRKDWMLYFISASINTASISVSTHDRKYMKDSLGIKTLKRMEKYQVDVLGNCYKVSLPEKRMGFDNMKSR